MKKQYFALSMTLVSLVAVSAAFTSSRTARADVGMFNMVHFVNPANWALGIEPMVTLSNGTGLGNGAGVGANLRFTWGMGDLANWSGIIGLESGTKQFRAGTDYTFDFFPDIEGQPGIGLGLWALFYHMVGNGSTVGDSNRLELAGIPYIHKTFSSSGTEIEPFLGIPLGIWLSQGQYQLTTAVSAGAMFKSSAHFRFVMELGVGAVNSDTYVSGGVAYYN